MLQRPTSERGAAGLCRKQDSAIMVMKPAEDES